MKVIDYTGKRNGRLTVLRKTPERYQNTYIMWECKCDCGNIVLISSKRLHDGLTQSCGCYNSEKTSERDREIRPCDADRFEGTKIGILTKKMGTLNKTGYKGVYFDKERNKYKANIKICGKSYSKRFDTLDEAVEYRRYLEEKYFEPVLQKYQQEQK